MRKAYAGERRAEAEAILERIRAEGPLAASDFEEGNGQGGWWEWGDAKRALEWLFWAGRITTATRRASFERVYDLTERVIPRRHPRAADAGGGRRAARAGRTAARGARHRHRGRSARLFPAEAGAGAGGRWPSWSRRARCAPSRWKAGARPAYLHRDARRPRRIAGQALLAPFDPLVWERGRTERLFGFRYRIEIYTPAEKRVHGYYVLPFLLGEALVARVDLKADRQTLAAAGAAVDARAGRAGGDRARGWKASFGLMARWLGLEAVTARNAEGMSADPNLSCVRSATPSDKSDKWLVSFRGLNIGTAAQKPVKGSASRGGSNMRLKTLVLCSSSAAILAFAATPALAQSDPATPPDPAVEAQESPADPEAGSPQTDDAAATATDAEGENEIVVTGLRRSLQSAQNIKRNSEQIVDAIVAEDIGKLPDVAVSDTAARIPGIQVERERRRGEPRAAARPRPRLLHDHL